jgi:predicted O-linked N-acetylglucosamine transferase (SPINDLY family)
MRQRAQGSFDQFIDISCKTDEEVVALARSMEIDIAVDLKGITRNSRLEIFAKRLAPIQVSYLGYPGTLGAEFIDYLIADDVLIPEKCQMYYCEKIAYLPYTYQPNDQKREIASSRWTRSQLGLPETGFVYCCFNNGFKLMPEVFTVWMHLLRRVPGSVLWLLGEEDVVLNLRAQAEKQGVDGERLIFASAVPLAQHLARQQYADLFLDTWPCNAHTTASDSLWAGLPVLTYCGLTFASRVAASLLNALDLPELVTFSREEYEEQAYILATQPNKLSSVREKIKQVKGQSPLFSGKLRAQHIEALYKEMVRKKGHGLSPESFHLFDF